MFFYDNSQKFSCSLNAQVTFVVKSQVKIISFQNYKNWYLIHTWSDKGLLDLSISPQLCFFIHVCLYIFIFNCVLRFFQVGLWVSAFPLVSIYPCVFLNFLLSFCLSLRVCVSLCILECLSVKSVRICLYGFLLFWFMVLSLSGSWVSSYRVSVCTVQCSWMRPSVCLHCAVFLDAPVCPLVWVCTVALKLTIHFKTVLNLDTVE